MIFYRQWSKVNALSFDLDDTLYDNHPIIIQAELALLSFLHQHYPDTAHTSKAFWQSQSRDLCRQNPLLRNDMSLLRHKSLHQGLQACGYQGVALTEAVHESYEYFYMERSNFTVTDEVLSVLSALAEKYPLVAITNGNVDLAQIGIADYFSHCFKASMQLPKKPSSIMFERTYQTLDIQPQQLLHVGDNLKNDVFGAISAGAKAAWYAYDRPMELNSESVMTLPHVQLDALEELLQLV